jgi:transcriptional regulator GlxA family with amidase domain
VPSANASPLPLRCWSSVGMATDTAAPVAMPRSVGCGSLAAFNRAFHRLQGVLPTQYRRGLAAT